MILMGKGVHNRHMFNSKAPSSVHASDRRVRGRLIGKLYAGIDGFGNVKSFLYIISYYEHFLLREVQGK